MKYKVGVTDYVEAPHDVEQEAFPEAVFVYLGFEDDTEFDSELLSELDAILVWHANIGKKTASNMKQGSIVVRYGVGFDNVDIKILTDARIPFCNTPDYGTEEVADTTCGMILNIQRKISAYDFASRTFGNGWQEHIRPPLRRTNKQTLGVVGVGRIGTAVINRIRGFGYRILGYDPYQPSGHEKAIGYIRSHSLQQLLTESDIVTVHCPLTNETQGMIDDDFIASMKKRAALVNTGRGQVIADFDCIEKHLRSGHLSAAAFDVLPLEPPPFDIPLIRAWKENEDWLVGRLIINPHTSYYSEDALYEMRYKAAETARLYLTKNIIRNQC
jgi:phosphoglycerate dehydrogenase-like enzyme